MGTNYVFLHQAANDIKIKSPWKQDMKKWWLAFSQYCIPTDWEKMLKNGLGLIDWCICQQITVSGVKNDDKNRAVSLQQAKLPFVGADLRSGVPYPHSS